MKQRHPRRHRRQTVLFPRLHHLGGQSGRASRLLERRHRTLYRRRHRRPAVLFPRLHHLGGQSGRGSRLLERRHRTLYRRRHRQPAVLLPQLHHLRGQSVRVSRLLERRHRTWQRRRFHWRSYNINSSNSRGNYSSCSSNDTTSNHDSWWEATYVGALLRPFDPGKGCQRDARIGVILLDLPFDRGKA